VVRKGEIISHETVTSLKEKFAGKFFQFTLESRPSEELIAALSPMGRVSVDDFSLRIELKSLDSLLPMVTTVTGLGEGITDFKTVENDLEDIFLEMIREEEE
jgi:ABC-type multidrug transport system ATPase subunit